MWNTSRGPTGNRGRNSSTAWWTTREQPVPYQLTDTHEALTTPLAGHFPPGLSLPSCQPWAIGSIALPRDCRSRFCRLTCTVTPTVLENDRLRVQLDPTTGAIVSCVDKRSQLELVGPGGWNVAQVLEDKSDTWSHGIAGYRGPLLGVFGAAQLTVADQGPLQISVLVERTFAGSRWLQQLILRRGSDEILIRNWLTWQGQWRVVKLAFDVNTPTPSGASTMCPSAGAAGPATAPKSPRRCGWMSLAPQPARPARPSARRCSTTANTAATSPAAPCG